MKIFLAGLMGAGKTTIGKKLAARLELPFIDLDRYIEQQKSMTIADMFAYFGEDFFRQAEHEGLKQVVQQENFVLACGGGTPCYFDNMNLMRTTGTTIYLKASAPFIASRIKQSKTPRPLFKGVTDEERLKVVETLFTKREEFYKQADFTLNVEKLTTEEVVNQILLLLDKK